MKKFFFFPAAMLCLLSCVVFSCTQELIDSPSTPEVTTTELTITATISDDPLTKTSVVSGEGNKKSVAWSSGDAISLFFNSGDNGGSRFVTADSGERATFTGSISSISGDLSEIGNTAYFWGLYPYNESASCNGTSISTVLTSEQLGVPGTFADNTAVTVGRSENLAIAFKNTNSIISFKVVHDNIHKVTLFGNNGEKISGNYSVSFDNDGTVVSTPAADAQTYISVTPAEGLYFVPDTWYYIVSLPVVFENGFSIQFETKAETATYTVTSSVELLRSKFYALTNKDSGLEFAVRPGNINIPDPIFKEYCVDNFDVDNDGEVSYAEAKDVMEINVYGLGIYSLEGVQWFPSLKELDCSYNQVLDLSLSNNVDLEILLCEHNFMESLDISNSPRLQKLHCQTNHLTSLNLTHNPELLSLKCEYNDLPAIDVSHNAALTYLSCQSNFLTGIDVSHNTALEQLFCHFNEISSLNLGSNTVLTTLDCSLNQLTTLDVSHNTALAQLYIEDNKLTSIDVSKNTALKYFDCNFNQFTSLDVSKNTALIRITCNENQLSALDVTKNTALTKLTCNKNQLSTLNLIYNTALTELDCGSNLLGSLDLTSNTALTTLYCGGNQFTTLNLSNNTALQYLDCESGHLTSLNVSNNPALYCLRCGFNQLTSLDVTNNTSLEMLSCWFNYITSLDVSNCPRLYSLICRQYYLPDSPDVNYLEYLYMREGQLISGINNPRDDGMFPRSTEIIYKSND